MVDRECAVGSTTPGRFSRGECDPGCDQAVSGGRGLITVSRGTFAVVVAFDAPWSSLIDGDLDPAARLVSVVLVAWGSGRPGSSRSDTMGGWALAWSSGTLGADADEAAADERRVCSDDGMS